jgi:hypothetical protein
MERKLCQGSLSCIKNFCLKISKCGIHAQSFFAYKILIELCAKIIIVFEFLSPSNFS